MIDRIASPAAKGGMFVKGSRRLRILAVIAMLIAVPVTLQAMAPEIWPSFTQTQADEGKTLYAERYANCHGATLEGVGTPALTAGDIVFTGDLDGNFLVLDSQSGKTLYSFNTGGGIAGGLSTCLVDGRQYVAAATGNNSRTVWRSGGAATIVIFGLADE